MIHLLSIDLMISVRITIINKLFTKPQRMERVIYKQNQKIAKMWFELACDMHYW